MNGFMKISQVKIIAADSDTGTVFCWLRYKHVLTVGGNGSEECHSNPESRWYPERRDRHQPLTSRIAKIVALLTW